MHTTRGIRPAHEADLPVLLRMGEQFVREHYHGLTTANPEQMARTAAWLMREGLLLVAETDGEPVGMLGAACFTHPISGAYTAAELFWWVDPEHRGVGVRLLKVFERWARRQGAGMVQMVAPNMHVGHFYERLGFTLVEYAYQRSL